MPGSSKYEAAAQARAVFSFHLEDELDLDGNIERERTHADGRSCVLADLVAEYFDKKI